MRLPGRAGIKQMTSGGTVAAVMLRMTMPTSIVLVVMGMIDLVVGPKRLLTKVMRMTTLHGLLDHGKYKSSMMLSSGMVGYSTLAFQSM